MATLFSIGFTKKIIVEMEGINNPLLNSISQYKYLNNKKGSLSQNNIFNTNYPENRKRK